MRSVTRALLIVLGALLCATALECVLRAFPVSKGLYRDRHPDLAFPLRYEPDRAWSHSIGWDLRFPTTGVTNNYGQVAAFDYQVGSRAAILIGDSFVEGQLNSANDSLLGQLAAARGSAEAVYAFGMSSNSLSDYLAAARYAVSEFRTDALVFLIVDGDVSESLFREEGHYYFVPDGGAARLEYEPLSPPSIVARALKPLGGSSLISYVFANLRFKFADLKVPVTMVAGTNATPAAPKVDPRHEQVIRAFLNGIVGLGVRPERIVLLMDFDRYALYDPKLATPRKDPAAVRRFFMDSASRLGMRVVDMENVFGLDYAIHHRMFDYFPLDRHWNGYGNHLAASEVAALLSVPVGPASAINATSIFSSK